MHFHAIMAIVISFDYSYDSYDVLQKTLKGWGKAISDQPTFCITNFLPVYFKYYLKVCDVVFQSLISIAKSYHPCGRWNAC